MELRELKQLLQEPYKTENWRQLLNHVFDNVQFLRDPNIIPTGDERIHQLKQYGSIRLEDGKNLALFELTLNDNVNLIRNRVGLNELVKKYIDQDTYHGILSIFEQGREDYRFTFTAKNTEFDEDQGFIDKDTDTKRFTYILGANESCRTAAERFDLLSRNSEKDIKAVEEAFNVDKLSKSFFNDYIAHFNSLVGYLKSEPSYYQGLFEKEETQARNYVKRIMGRLIFLKFIQKKGWLGVPVSEPGWNNGDYNFLENQYQKFPTKDLFVSQFLNPLFYEGLNRGNRLNFEFQNFGYKIPFLSGGLFENENTKDNRIDFPESYLTSLFDFFGQYNFTIDENDLNDKEVGIDPEMLGHIFENLLEDNKDKGAFYTPKDIVRYMCQESLKEYLKTYLQQEHIWPEDETRQEDLENKLSRFVEKKETAAILKFDKELATALRDVKICDPAIGSGAFPMGLLQEIFKMIKNLHEESPDRVGEVWGMMGKNWEPTTVKQNIIQNSIYGVDIEPGAVDIARLRFWLSLVIEEEEPKPLPHLDYKIVVGDSLVSKLEDTIIQIDWEVTEDNAQTEMFGNPNVERRKEILNDITKKQKQIFDPNSDDESLGLEIRNLKIDLLINQLELMIKTQGLEEKPTQTGRNLKRQTEVWLQTKGWKNQIKRLQKMKEGDKTPLEFFDWKLDFPEVLNDEVANTYGFDIVIGNPPYYQIQKFEEKDKTDLENANYETFSRTGDIYCLFYEKGIELLKHRGVLSYITSNTWMRTKFGEKMRSYFIKNSNPCKLLNFEDTKIFPSATVEVNIMFTRREDYTINLDAVAIKGDYVPKTSIVKYFEDKKISLKELSKDSWIIVDKKDYLIKEQIESNGTPLVEWNVNMNYGFKTGFNEPFFINREFRDELIRLDKKNEAIIKPLLRGREIRKFSYQFANNYVIFPHNGTKNKPRIDVQRDYPIIFKHLLKYKDKNSELVKPNSRGVIQTLMDRKDQGEHWTNMRDCAYLDSFDSDKIIWLSISDKPAFALDINKMYVTAPAYIMTSDCNRYLLTLLNSKAMEWYLDKVSSSTGQGTNQWSKIFVEKLPIPELNSDKRKPFEILADYLTLINAAENHHLFENISSEIISRQFEEVLNMMVYELYFEKHMKENKIDVLQFIDFKDISELDNLTEKRNVIQNAYYKLQEKDNPIRNRILLASTRSVDIIKRINETTH